MSEENQPQGGVSSSVVGPAETKEPTSSGGKSKTTRRITEVPGRSFIITGVRKPPVKKPPLGATPGT
jgi:hypothetical protein